MTDKLREKIAEENPYPKDEDTAFLTEVGLHDAYMAGVDATLAAPKIQEGQELLEKAESGKLVELDEDQTWPKIPEHCAGIVLERDRILRAAGFRRVKVKG